MLNTETINIGEKLYIDGCGIVFQLYSAVSVKGVLGDRLT